MHKMRITEDLVYKIAHSNCFLQHVARFIGTDNKTGNTNNWREREKKTGNGKNARLREFGKKEI